MEVKLISNKEIVKLLALVHKPFSSSLIHYDIA